MSLFVSILGYVLAMSGLLGIVFHGAILRLIEPRPQSHPLFNVLRTLASVMYMVGGKLVGFVMIIIGVLLIALGHTIHP